MPPSNAKVTQAVLPSGRIAETCRINVGRYFVDHKFHHFDRNNIDKKRTLYNTERCFMELTNTVFLRRNGGCVAYAKRIWRDDLSQAVSSNIPKTGTNCSVSYEKGMFCFHFTYSDAPGIGDSGGCGGSCRFALVHKCEKPNDTSVVSSGLRDVNENYPFVGGGFTMS